MVLVYIYGITAGLAFGISVALLFTIWLVKKSNDIGDSKGEFHDFSEYMDVIRITPDEALKYVETGKIHDSKTIIAIYAYLLKFC